MAWHVFESKVLREENGGGVSIRLVSADFEPYSVEGTVLYRNSVTAIVIHRATTDGGTKLHIPPTDVLYLDPATGKSSYDLETLLPLLPAVATSPAAGEECLWAV